MSERAKSVLLVGESGVGKTHYGAQLLKRLMKGDGMLRMRGAATNLDPFETALERLNEGRAADHTPTPVYVESIWPLEYDDGSKAELVWPDYGGEQIKAMVTARSIPLPWMRRIAEAHSWLLLLRLNKMRASDDIFSKPLAQLRQRTIQSAASPVSDQSRLIELLQMLMNVRGHFNGKPLATPHLALLLTCWDELQGTGLPGAALRAQLPMFFDFVVSNWQKPKILGLSALERALSPEQRDAEFASRGPESFGYVISHEGDRSSDLTLPIKLALVGTI
jgi:hypothetical protein